MPASFYTEFNKALPEMQDVFGTDANPSESWIFNNKIWPAIAIEDLRLSRLAGEAGGPLAQASVTLHIRKSVYTESGVVRGNKITVRNETVRVMTISDEGDDAVAVICGPLGVPIVT